MLRTLLVIFLFTSNGFSADADLSRIELTANSIWKTAEAIFWRTSLSIIVEQPSNLIMTTLQNNNGTTIFGVLNQGWKKQGVSFLLKGSFETYQNVFFRNTYSWIIFGHAPDVYRNLLNRISDKQHPYLEKSLVGLTWGTINALVETPIEQRRVEKVIHGEVLSSTIRLPWRAAVASLYRGFWLTFQMGSFSCVNFLILDRYLRDQFKNQNPDGKLTGTDQLLTGVLLGATHWSFIMPFTMLRTTLQKQCPNSSVSYWKIMQDFYAQGLVRTLYTGGSVRFIRIVLFSIFDSFWLNHYDQLRDQNTAQ